MKKDCTKVQGHAEHFLERLDRVMPEHMQLALQLYYDPPLVGRILTEGRLALCWQDEPERLALPLATGPEPPYVIVERSGRFVTCLAAGMEPYGLVVIPFAVVKATITRQERIHTLGDYSGPTTEIHARLFTDPESISREDYQALARWNALLVEHFLREAAENERTIIEFVQKLVKVPAGRLRRRASKVPHIWWRLILAEGTLMSLGTTDLSLFKRFFADRELALDMPWMVGRYHHAGMAMRGLWLAARLGPMLFDEVVGALSEVRVFSLHHVRFLTLALAAIGMRHGGLHAATLRALGDLTAMTGGTPERYTAQCARSALQVLERRPVFEQSARRSMWSALEGIKPAVEGTPWAFTCAEDLPTPLVVACMASQHFDAYESDDGRKLLLIALPMVAQAAAEDLYMPDAILSKAPLPKPTDEAVYNMLLNQTYHEGKPRTLCADVKPGRNEPCSCGSGKKYKKCCG